jgi:hypothetical protein
MAVFIVLGDTQNVWFIMENHIKMHDLGVPPFQETSKCIYKYPVFVGNMSIQHWRDT